MSYQSASEWLAIHAAGTGPVPLLAFVEKKSRRCRINAFCSKA